VSVNFPLILAVLLALFGAATLVHVLTVSVSRRRHEAGILKALGFLRRQVGAVVCWQATTIAVAGIVAGVPLGMVAGRVAWRAFAAYLGVVPVPVTPAWLLAGLAAGVLVAANALAITPAWLAARSHAGELLSTQ
jgi:ABC-type lipoprotein release transport system permease subunit